MISMREFRDTFYGSLLLRNENIRAFNKIIAFSIISQMVGCILQYHYNSPFLPYVLRFLFLINLLFYLFIYFFFFIEGTYKKHRLIF
jgi:hypothetical protein